MPYDKNGQELKDGDSVQVPCKVVAVFSGDDYCNVSLQTEEPCHPGELKSTISLNSKQVVKCDNEDEGQVPFEVQDRLKKAREKEVQEAAEKGFNS